MKLWKRQSNPWQRADQWLMGWGNVDCRVTRQLFGVMDTLLIVVVVTQVYIFVKTYPPMLLIGEEGDFWNIILLDIFEIYRFSVLVQYFQHYFQHYFPVFSAFILLKGNIRQFKSTTLDSNSSQGDISTRLYSESNQSQKRCNCFSSEFWFWFLLWEAHFEDVCEDSFNGVSCLISYLPYF